MLFAAENGVELDFQVVNLFTGEHFQEPYGVMNLNRCVPVLEDGDFRLTESSAIIKYLADKFRSPAYPTDLRLWAKVNERRDWFNTGLYRDLGFGLIYPQVLLHYHWSDDKVQVATLAWGRDRAKSWLRILDEHMIGPGHAYVCGDEITTADYFGAMMLTLGEVIRLDYSAYANVAR
ncbi:MAG: glutathione S-transferase family protein [Burkholderiales bacterium]